MVKEENLQQDQIQMFEDHKHQENKEIFPKQKRRKKNYIYIGFIPLIFCSCYIKKVIEYFVDVT